MVIEHEFITTQPPMEAIRIAADYLGSRGFTRITDEADFALDEQAAAHLHMKRGKSKPRGAKRITDLPQVVRVEYDRGRVCVACAITPGGKWGGKRQFWTGVSELHPDRLPVHRDLLLAVANGLEQRLAYNSTGVGHFDDWDAVETRCEMLRKAKLRNSIIGAVAVVVGFASLIATIVLVSRH